MVSSANQRSTCTRPTVDLLDEPRHKRCLLAGHGGVVVVNGGRSSLLADHPEPGSDQALPIRCRWSCWGAGDDTETRGSRRTIALPDRCVEVLEDHRDRQRMARTVAGERWADHDLVFATEAGTPMDAADVRRDFRRVAATAGLDDRRWSPRELRHSFVPLLSDGGMPIEQIARLIGHAGGSEVTEAGCRKQLRPVIEDGAIALNRVFPRRGVRPSLGPSPGSETPRRPGPNPLLGF